MLKTIALAAASLSLVGCASIVNDTTHGMRLDTKTASGDLVSGADCTISNDYGSTQVRSGTTVQVRRSSKDMDISCTHPSNPEARARAISRANAGLAGNIIFGGGIGAIIDHSKGTAYTYPTWVQLVFGQTLVFDRTAEKEGAPTPGAAPEVFAKTGTQSANPASSTSAACSQQVAGVACR